MKSIVVFNPVSGLRTFPKKLKYVKEELNKNGYDEVLFVPSNAPKSVENIVKSYDDSDVDLLIVSGGDGTLNEAINGLIQCKKQPRFAYIPSGTTNDVGSILNIGRNVRKALKIAIHGENVKMDVSKMDERYFVYVGAAGKFAPASYLVPPSIKRKWGKLAYVTEAIKQLPDSSEFKMNLKITCDDGRVVCGKYFLFLLLNAQHVGGFPIYRKNKAKMNDGIIDLTLLERENKHTIWTTIKFFVFGDNVKRDVVTLSGSSFIIESEKALALNVDGELYEEKKQVNVSVIKEAINIMVSTKTKKRYF